MNREQIDVILSESFLYHKSVSIQLNTKDEFGRFLDPLVGLFLGEAYDDYFVINDQQIFWSDVRHIEIKKEQKWFDIDYFRNKGSPSKVEEKNKEIDSEVELIKTSIISPF